MTDTALCFLTATELAQKIRSGELSAVETMEAHLAQIEKVNPQVNAIVTLLPEMAMEAARKADEKLARGEEIGPLHGLPVAHKDLVQTKGIRTTFGSLVYEDFIPEEDALLVERLREAGAILLGKTNTPEFGAGSQTFNKVFGVTKNPYDLSKTCGGSSGGAAVSVACRMLPFADGSDLGGSLRNPTNFCNVVGFRPSVGRVPSWPNESGWNSFAVDGPIARTVEDTALMLSVLAGPDLRSPISLPESGAVFRKPLERNIKGIRIAWSRNLGGLPVDSRVTETLEKQRHVFEDLGCIVGEGFPDFSDADEIFKNFRAWFYELKLASLLPEHRDKIKETVIWNIESGMKLSGPELGRAEVKRTALFHRVREFMQNYDYLALPVSQVPPFPIEQEFVSKINGLQMETYLDWMRSCYFISVTGQPAISVPCGFTNDGLPVGLQLVGKPQDDLGVLQLAHAFEKASGFYQQIPDLLNNN
ncbi:MAG: amidase [SAR324 cluster bacterium]|nr:amidase [SAR324 cluster bacterium]MBL7036205.1 amidase [SAR324 cluster bacterium]